MAQLPDVDTNATNIHRCREDKAMRTAFVRYHKYDARFPCRWAHGVCTFRSPVCRSRAHAHIRHGSSTIPEALHRGLILEDPTNSGADNRSRANADD